MMTAFWLIVALMMLACIAFIVLPLSRPRTHAELSEAQTSIAIHRERLRELELSHVEGMTSDDALRFARDDIARQVLADAAQGDDDRQSEAVPAADRRALLGAALAIPAVAVLLYFWLGDVGALNEITATRESQATAVSPGRGGEHSVTQMVARLETRLRSSPDDPDAWSLLGRSYGYLKQHDKAVQALSRANNLDAGNTRIMADLAEALMLANGHRVDARVQSLLDQVLASEPEHPKARFLLGLKQSAGTQPIASPSAEGKSNGVLKVRVTVSAALRTSMPSEATVFVFARPAKGPRMPLAIVRRAARELPVEVELGDGQAMSPEHRLSQHARVIVGARVSVSGNATPSAGDLEGLSAPIEWTRTGVTQLEIDHVVH